MYHHSHEEQERLRQREAGRLMATGDDHTAPQQQPPKLRERITNSGRRLVGDPESKSTGHQAMLEMMKSSKARIRLDMKDGTQVIGTITHCDADTISVLHDNKISQVYFKHAMKSFAVEKGDVNV